MDFSQLKTNLDELYNTLNPYEPELVFEMPNPTGNQSLIDYMKQLIPTDICGYEYAIKAMEFYSNINQAWKLPKTGPAKLHTGKTLFKHFQENNKAEYAKLTAIFVATNLLETYTEKTAERLKLQSAKSMIKPKLEKTLYGLGLMRYRLDEYLRFELSKILGIDIDSQELEDVYELLKGIVFTRSISKNNSNNSDKIKKSLSYIKFFKRVSIFEKTLVLGKTENGLQQILTAYKDSLKYLPNETIEYLRNRGYSMPEDTK